jgi:NADH dehydrogenase [ubiquinone] 1 alpha subcomplex assembly factor 7
MADERSPLENEIRRLIAVAGPMSIAEYMRLCLTHPQYGYYVTRDPLGSDGDFITSPEISQMFGELIGLWMAAVWQQMGSPENMRVVELGPGRGTLIVDALRAGKVVGDFHAAVVVHLVEISPKLQQVQQQRLESLGVPMLWHAALAEVPSGPTIIIANEFIDALPVHQAVKQADGWHERVVEIAPGGDLAIGTTRDPLPHFEATAPGLASVARGLAL